MAHGKSLTLREIRRPEPEFVHEHAPTGGVFSAPSNEPYVNPAKDRSLSGKARRRARRADKAAW